MNVHFLNTETKNFFNEDNYLYRIMPLDRFLDFLNNKFVMVSPTLWSDPYEKAFLEAKYEYHGEQYACPLKPSKGFKIFAQCWTATKQLEAMWKGFAPNKDGVLIKIPVGKIIQILESISQNSDYDFYIGKAEYQNGRNLYSMKSEGHLWNDIKNGHITNSIISLLLKKRKPFAYENEFRVIAKKREGVAQNSVLFLMGNNLVDTVEYLKFDPRMGNNLFSFSKKAILNDFPNLKIHQSKLYSKPIKKLSFGGRMPIEINDEIVF